MAPMQSSRCCRSAVLPRPRQLVPNSRTRATWVQVKTGTLAKPGARKAKTQLAKQAKTTAARQNKANAARGLQANAKPKVIQKKKLNVLIKKTVTQAAQNKKPSFA